MNFNSTVCFLTCPLSKWQWMRTQNANSKEKMDWSPGWLVLSETQWLNVAWWGAAPPGWMHLWSARRAAREARMALVVAKPLKYKFVGLYPLPTI
jgi:hypothetical protein